jgi:hypothetical protein
MASRTRIVLFALLFLSALAAWHDVRAQFGLEQTCSAPTIPCPNGLSCSYSGQTCLTDGSGPSGNNYGACVWAFNLACWFSTHQCNGKLIGSGASCFCYGADLGPGAC